MTLPDSNVWLALALPVHAFHPQARAWFVRQPLGHACLCRATQHSLLRLLTTTALFAPYGLPPLSNAAAWSLFDGLRADPRTGWSEEPPDLAAHWKVRSSADHPAPKMWMDAYLAAFAEAGGLDLVTTDHALARSLGSLSVLLLEP